MDHEKNPDKDDSNIMGVKINYSIIIPHKNTPELLQRCLNSIPQREDLQVIIIDNNSDPNNVNFSDFPGKNNPLIDIVFSKEKEGVGYARNIGLSKAVGKWLLFADADDYFTGDFLKVIDEYNNTDYDLIYFGIHGIDSETKKENHIGKYYQYLMHNAIKNHKHDKYKYSNLNSWGKLIRYSLIKDNNIIFNEIKSAEDKIFSIKTAYYSKNTFFDERKIYFYESRKGSLISINSLELNFDRFYAAICSTNFLREHKKSKYRENIAKRLFRLIDFNNMEKFRQAFKMLKGNCLFLLIDIFSIVFLFPYRILKKLIKNILWK